MKKMLLATTALLALALAAGQSRAAEGEASAYADVPSSFVSLEAGYAFDGSPTNADFKTEEKLGNLDPLHPGQGGGAARAMFGQSLADDWDFRFGAAVITLAEDQEEYAAGEPGDDTWERTAADQSTRLSVLDAELGFDPGDIGVISPRLFAGLRGLHSVSELDWSTSGRGVDKIGEYSDAGRFYDEVFAGGPRIGAELTMPITGHDAALVASVSGSVLFATYDATDSAKPSLSESGTRTIWNAEAVGGLQMGLGHGADLTVGYRVAEFGNLMEDRADIDQTGNFDDHGSSSLVAGGPFARLTIELP